MPAPVNVQEKKKNLLCQQEKDSVQILFFIPNQNRVILQI